MYYSSVRVYGTDNEGDNEGQSTPQHRRQK